MFDLSSDFGINSDGEDGARKQYASFVQDQGPKVRALLQPFVFFIREHATDPVPTTQQPETRTSFCREELRRERAACRSRLAWDLPHSHRCIHAAAGGFVRSLGSFALLPKLEHPLAEMDGSS